jgi:methyl-accepting chemotaxis protein
MVKPINSLQTKLTASFIALILIISGLAFFYTFAETKKALKETMREELQAVAASIAAGLQGEAEPITGLEPGDEHTAVFKRLSDKLYAIQKSHPDIKYVYVYKTFQGRKVKFVIDPSYGRADGDDAAEIGDTYDQTTDEMLLGLTKPSADKGFSSDKWGTFMSGYAPIKDSGGKIIGSIGVDMLSARVLQKEDFIGNTIYIIIFSAVFLAGIIIVYFSRTIIRDIKKLNKHAEDVSTGVIEKDVDVRRNDEIGELGESFQRMIMSLRILKLYPENRKDRRG